MIPVQKLLTLSAFFLFASFFSIAVAATPLTTERIASGLDRPIYVTAAGGDHHRLFVVEQRGLIKIIKDGAVLSTPFIDLTGTVSQTGSERGLLGLAFHPSYDSNGFFYVNYTRVSDNATVVERYSVSAADPDVADATSGTVVVGPIAQPYGNHNGGCIQFGADGKLYVGMGDGGSAGDPQCRAQNGSSLLGKMLRVNDDGSIPADNPFVNDPDVLDEIWALGLRNPWRFSFDQLEGHLYIGDVGQQTWEEVDYQPASSTGGENYGWKVMEGSSCFNSSGCDPDTPPCNDPSLTLPLLEYEHTNGRCSVTGGYVYRGCAIPDLQGAYFVGDYCTGEVVSIRHNGNQLTAFTDHTAEIVPSVGSIDLIASFGEDSEGELYIVDLGFGSNDGEIYKLVPDVTPVYEDLGFGLAGTDGVVPMLDVCGLTGSGESAFLRLRDAAPSSTVFLVLAFSTNPVPLFGGTLVPAWPAWKTYYFASDGNGRHEFPFAGGGGPLDVFAQYLVDDPGAVQNVAFSNAVRVMLQP